MYFKRLKLVSAILKSQEINAIKEYQELLVVYYKLLKQESVNKSFLDGIYYYEPVSSTAIGFYQMFV